VVLERWMLSRRSRRWVELQSSLREVKEVRSQDSARAVRPAESQSRRQREEVGERVKRWVWV
jgi:hypothetical protein